MYSGNRWRLGHRPGLDGLRGVAILLVVAYHGLILAGRDSLSPAMGAVGVGVFFTLSGFLITSLLLGDLSTFGRVRFGRFYRRRALRLLPAVVALVAAESVMSRLVSGFTSPASVASTLLYVQNWRTALGGAADGLNHTWSLAVEEQFYLVWPIVMVALYRIGWRVVVTIALLGSVGAVVLREHLWNSGASTWRIYAGTDTRADSLLIGCALAVVMFHGLRDQKARPALVLTGLALVGVTCQMSPFGMIVAAPLTAAVGTSCVIFGSTQGEGVAWLAPRWLVWVGQRSYGLYLWSVPTMGYLWGHELGSPGVTVVVYLAVSLGLTVASWRYVERRFLRRRSTATGPNLLADVPRPPHQASGRSDGCPRAPVEQPQLDVAAHEIT